MTEKPPAEWKYAHAVENLNCKAMGAREDWDQHGSDVLGLAEEADERIAALEASSAWQLIATAPKDRLIDIWISSGVRWADCYYDSITDQWRTSRPSGHLVWVPARSVTHWRLPPEPPID